MTKELSESEKQIRTDEARPWLGFSLGSNKQRTSPFKTEREIKDLARIAKRGLNILDEENDLWTHGTDAFSVWVKKANAGDKNAARSLLVNLQHALETKDVIPPALAIWVADCLRKVLENGINMATAFSISQEETGFSNRPAYNFRKTRQIEIWQEIEIIRLKKGKGKEQAAKDYASRPESSLAASTIEKYYREGRQLIELYLTNIQKPEE